MKEFIDSIFSPASQFLQGAKQQLLQASLSKNKPIDLDVFFAPFALMGNSWVFLIKAVIISLVTITALYAAVTIRELYLQFKQSVKWW